MTEQHSSDTTEHSNSGAQQIQVEAEEARQRVADDLGSIREKFTTGHAKGVAQSVANSGAQQVRAKVQDKGTNAMSYVRDNPLPIALIGAGVGLLVAEGIRRSRRGHLEFGGAQQQGRERLNQMQEQGREKLGQAQDKGREKLEQAQDKSREALDRARAGTEAARTRAQESYYRAEGGFERVLQERPLAVGATALAAGAVVGMLLPRTRVEDRLLGPKRDELVESARRKVEAARNIAQMTMQHAVDKAHDEAEERSLTPEAVKRDAQQRAEEARNAARETARDAMNYARDEARERDVI